jgi:hypothetical protein
MKLLASTLAIASMTLIMPFAYAKQAQCETARPFATMTESSGNRTAAKLAKTQFCRVLDTAIMNRG